MNAALAACLVALKSFAWPALSDWDGLPECTLADVGRVFSVPGDGWRGSGYLGEDYSALDWLSMSGGGFPDSVRIWLDGNKVMMMESRVNGASEVTQTLTAKLGQPAAKLDSYFHNALIEKCEWVYPDRGLALFVEPETHVLLRVAAFPRTSLQEYRKKFRLMAGRTVRLGKGLHS